MMAKSSLALLAIPIVIGFILIYFSIRFTISNGIVSFSFNPTMLIAGILIAIIGSVIVVKVPT